MKLTSFIKKNKDFINVLCFDLFFKLLSALITIILVRTMSKSDYASFTVFTSISTMLSGIVGTGLGLLYIRRTTEILSKGEKDRSGLYLQCVCIIVLITVIVCIFLNNIIAHFYGITIELCLASCIYSGIISVCTLNVNRYQAYEKYKVGGWINNIRNFITIIFILLSLLILTKINSIIAIYIYIISGVISAIIGICIIMRSESINFKNVEVISLIKEMGLLFLYYILVNLNSGVDIALLKRLSAGDVIAEYGIAYKYYILLISILPSITAVFRVRTSKIEYTLNSVNRRNSMKNWIKKTSYYLIPIAVLGQIIISPVMNLLNGVQYKNSIGAFRIFFVGAIFSYILSPGVSFLISSKKYIYICILAFSALIINVIGNIILIPKFGLIGATFSTVFSTFIINFGANFIEYINDRE